MARDRSENARKALTSPTRAQDWLGTFLLAFGNLTKGFNSTIQRGRENRKVVRSVVCKRQKLGKLDANNADCQNSAYRPKKTFFLPRPQCRTLRLGSTML